MTARCSIAAAPFPIGCCRSGATASLFWSAGPRRRHSARASDRRDRVVDVQVRFYIDPESGQAHVLRHGVTETEVEEALDRPGEDRAGREGSRVVIGRTVAGRCLRVVYVPDPEPGSIFVITAYELRGKPLIAYRQRMRRKQK